MEKETFDSVMKNFIQVEAETVLERELTEGEYEDVNERILGSLFMLIQDKIHEMTQWTELLDRNKKDEKGEIYYKVLWKNENAHQKVFVTVFEARIYEDAKKYVYENGVMTEYDQYKIMAVTTSGSVTEVETIGEGLGA